MNYVKLILSKQKNGNWFCLAKVEGGGNLMDGHGDGIESCLPTKKEAVLSVLGQIDEISKS